MFELKVILPLQKDLCIRVKDYDFIGTDEVIGETWIDLENRVLSKYRATCGLPSIYNELIILKKTRLLEFNRFKFRSGINKWRDSKKPSEILENVCKLRNLNYIPPKAGDISLKIDNKVFHLEKYGKNNQKYFLKFVLIYLIKLKETPDKLPNRGLHLGYKHERLCLHVLKEFDLVPEHVETRKLYNSVQPGMEQVVKKIKI